MLVDEGGAVIAKPAMEAEVSFYQQAPSALRRWMPAFIGTLALHMDGEGDDVEAMVRARGRGKTAIVLENLTFGYAKPCVMDVKLGRRLYDDGASAEKRRRMQTVSRTTTSGSLGFRVCGMRVHTATGVVEYGKEYGRALTPASIGGALKDYFAGCDDVQVVEAMIEDLAQIEGVLETTDVEMYSASLLFLYDAEPGAQVSSGASESESTDSGEMDICRVRLIDFARSRFTSTKDENTLFGMRNLLDLFQQYHHGYHMDKTSLPVDFLPSRSS